MSIPNFCKTCTNILDLVDINTELMNCSHCKQKIPIGDNRLVFNRYYNAGKRVMSDNEVQRLMFEPTTQKIVMQCQACEGNIMATIIDENYRSILACLNCQSVFR